MLSRVLKSIAFGFFSLIGLTLLVAYVCLQLAFPVDPLLPAPRSVIPWQLETSTDAELGGSSTMSVNDATYTLDYDFVFQKDVDTPFVSATLAFDGFDDASKFIDMTKYSTLSFNIKCTPPNLLSLAMFTFDQQVSEPGEVLTYRMSAEYFSCEEDWTRVEMNLRDFEVPDWWLAMHDLAQWDRRYRLDKVLGLSFGVTWKTPVNTPSNVKISELTLHGFDRRYIVLFGGVSVVIWAAFIFWLFRQYKKYLIVDIKNKLEKEQPWLAHQQLPVHSHRGGRKEMVLRFMVTEYANPEMSLETAAEKLGINRTKINQILKEELGFTFSTYLNRLRLSEAARLLKENNQSSVAEVAYQVGYNNASYFNKLFKSEYGCTPRTFKKTSLN